MYGLAGIFVVVVASVLALLGAGCLVLAVISIRQVLRRRKEGILAWGWGWLGLAAVVAGGFIGWSLTSSLIWALGA